PLWLHRGHVLASRHQWPQAADHYSKVLQSIDEFARLTDEEKLRQTSQLIRSRLITEYDQKQFSEGRPSGFGKYTLYHLTLGRLLAGDEQGSQEACERIARDADNVDEALFAGAFSRALSASAAETIDRAVTIRLAERAVAADPKVACYWYAL